MEQNIPQRSATLIVEKAAAKPPGARAYRVFYDDQCEICQAGVSWVKALDHEQKTICLPIIPEARSTAGACLEMDDCLRDCM